MQIEIEDPELMMYLAAMIINFHSAGYDLTGREKLDKYFPDHETVMTPALHEKRYEIYSQLTRELKKYGKEIEKRWDVLNSLLGYELEYDKDGMNFGSERISLETMEQMVEACKNAD